MSTDYFHEKPSDVKFQRDVGWPGQRIPSVANYREDDAINASATLAHVVALTPTSYAGSDAFAFTVTRDGRSTTYSFTSAAGDDTQAEACTAIAAYILDQSGGALDYLYPTATSTTVVLTALDSGADSAFVVSALTNLSQSTTQTGANAAAILDGRAVIRSTKPTVGGALTLRQPATPLSNYMALPSSTTLPAITHTFVAAGTYSSGDIFELTGAIQWGDKTIPIAIPFGIGQTTVDAAFAALVTAFNASRAGDYATAAYTSASNTLVITSDYYGLYMDFDIPASGSNTITKTSANTDKVAADLFLGVTARRYVQGTTTLGEFNNSTPANDSGIFVSNGGIYVEFLGTAPTDGATVYLCVGSGEEGRLSATAAANRVPLPQCRWRPTRTGQTVAGVILRAA